MTGGRRGGYYHIGKVELLESVGEKRGWLDWEERKMKKYRRDRE